MISEERKREFNDAAVSCGAMSDTEVKFFVRGGTYADSHRDTEREKVISMIFDLVQEAEEKMNQDLQDSWKVFVVEGYLFSAVKLIEKLKEE